MQRSAAIAIIIAQRNGMFGRPCVYEGDEGDCGESGGVVRLSKSETRARKGHPRLRKRKRCFRFSAY